MKLSRREAIMLAVLLIIGMFFVEYRFVLTPGIARFVNLSEELSSLEFEYQTINYNLTLAKSFEENRDENLAAIEVLSEPFLDGVSKDALLVYTHNMMTKHGFTLDSYSPSPNDTELLQPEQVEIQELTYRIKEIAMAYRGLGSEDAESPADDVQQDEELNRDVVELYSLQVNAAGSYDQIKTMIDDFKSLGKWIIVTSINMSPAQQEGNQLAVSFIVNYYGIEKLTQSESDALNDWIREVFPTSEVDPFYATAPTPTPTPEPEPDA